MRVLLIVVASLATGCAATGAHPNPFPRPGTSPRVGPPASVPLQDAGSVGTSGYELSGTALALRGVPYRNGGADPKGFDCSGFVWFVFAQHGLAMPRTVDEQYRVGGPVDPQHLGPGDLVFFSTSGPGASHVGIAIGGDSFVHAPSSAGVVRVERMSSGYWAARFIGARRVL